jgi:hypothetical protein
MSNTLHRDLMLSVFAMILALTGPDRCVLPFYFEAVALYVLARIQDGIDRSAA